MKTKRLDIKGLTIVELLVTCVIISIMSIVMVDFLGNWIEQYAISETRTALLSDAQNALDRITDTIRLSSAADQNNRWEDINAPNAPSDLLSWASGASTLVLASAVEDTSGAIVFSDASNYTSQKNNQIYFVQNGVLYQRTLAAPVSNNKVKTTCPGSAASAACPADKKLTENVSAFLVKYYNAENQEVAVTDARSIEMSITLTKTAYKQQIQRTYTTRMVFRND